MNMVGLGFVVDDEKTVQSPVPISLFLATDCVSNLVGIGSEGRINQSL